MTDGPTRPRPPRAKPAEPVMTVGVEQFALVRARLRVQPLDPRMTSRQCTHSALRREVEAVKGISATLASEAHRPSSSSQRACGYSIAVQASSGIAAIATAYGLIRAVTENQAFPRVAARMVA